MTHRLGGVGRETLTLEFGAYLIVGSSHAHRSLGPEQNSFGTRRINRCAQAFQLQTRLLLDFMRSGAGTSHRDIVRISVWGPMPMGSLPSSREWSAPLAKAQPVPAAQMPTRYGAFVIQVFTDGSGTEHIALVKGAPANGCLVRLHSECATGDIFGSLRCDCRDQLEVALQRIDEAGEGILIYLRGHEGRGIGLGNKILAYALQEQGMDTLDANVHLGFAPDARNYYAAFEILRRFHLSAVELRMNLGDGFDHAAC
jgi:GTP cyclohydrolase II